MHRPCVSLYYLISWLRISSTIKTISVILPLVEEITTQSQASSWLASIPSMMKMHRISLDFKILVAQAQPFKNHLITAPPYNLQFKCM